MGSKIFRMVIRELQKPSLTSVVYKKRFLKFAIDQCVLRGMSLDEIAEFLIKKQIPVFPPKQQSWNRVLVLKIVQRKVT
jgi:hypothetical protein